MAASKKLQIDLKVYNDIVSKALESLISAGPFAIQEQDVNGVKVKCYVNQAKTMPEFYAQQFPLWKDRTFIVFENERYTYGEIAATAGALAYELQHTFNVKVGDRVALTMLNFPEWCVSFFAITAMGAVCVPLNGWWIGSELEYGLLDSGSKVLICDGERYKRAVPYLSKLGIKAIVAREKNELPSDIFLYQDVIQKGFSHCDVLPEVKLSPEDNVLIMYTSGTTGHPKGVVITHRGLTAQMSNGLLSAKLLEVLTPPGTPPEPHQPCALCPVPLFHVAACQHNFLQCLCTGRKLVLMAKWDPGYALQLIEKERATGWMGVPTMIQDLMEHSDFFKRDLSSLKVISTGGAANPVSQVFKTEERFSVARPSQAYGLTEVNGAICSIQADNYLKRPNSCGLPLPNVEVKVVDLDSGRTLPAGEEGELWIKSSLNMKEYWGKPKETAQVLTKDGWFRTGDVAKLDTEGYIYITDRAKDIIIRGGENISCAEVENAFMSHPFVMECAVFGLPDDRLGEIVAIKIMRKRNETKKISAKELISFVSKQLANFKIPKAENIYFTDEPLPRGATGKTLKRVIKEETMKELKLSKNLKSKL